MFTVRFDTFKCLLSVSITCKYLQVEEASIEEDKQIERSSSTKKVVKGSWNSYLSEGQKQMIFETMVSNPSITIQEMRQKFLETYPEIEAMSKSGMYTLMRMQKALVNRKIKQEQVIMCINIYYYYYYFYL